ncbi:MAG TPA: cell wall hydrolase [Candidatus Binatia bacterium]|nr:cell wall hydrolase [Candidatus Binatia bacterium]
MRAYNVRNIGLIVLGITAVLELGLILFDRQSWDIEAAQTSPDDLRCLALTVYWEARAGGREAMEAVAWVVLNRRKNPDFPDTICKVVREGGENPPCQFSYWCDGEPDTPKNHDVWKLAREVAAQMLENPPSDPTGGALFFHSVELASPWTKERKRTVEIGRHIFYR